MRAHTSASRFDHVFAVVALFFLAGSFLPFANRPEAVFTLDPTQLAASDLTEVDTLSQLLFLTIYLIGALRLIPALGFIPTVIRRQWPALFLTCMGVASVLWSMDPGLTLRRAAALVGTTVLGVYFASRFTLVQQLRLLTVGVGTAVVMSAPVSILSLDYGQAFDLETGERVWRGIFAHKNVLGRAAVLFLLSSLVLRRVSRHRLLLTLAAVGTLPVIWFSQSKTALAVGGVLLIVWWVLPLLRWRGFRAASGLTFAISAAVAAMLSLFANFSLVLGTVLGRDITLTGRTALWESVSEAVAERPWLGYGYGAFWQGFEGPSGEVWRESGIRLTHSHNGVLELMLDLGAWGVLIMLVSLIVYFQGSVLVARSADPARYWPLVFLLFIIAYNLTETTLLRQHSIYWTLYVALGCSLPTRSEAPAERPANTQLLPRHVQAPQPTPL